MAFTALISCLILAGSLITVHANPVSEGGLGPSPTPTTFIISSPPTPTHFLPVTTLTTPLLATSTQTPAPSTTFNFNPPTIFASALPSAHVFTSPSAAATSTNSPMSPSTGRHWPVPGIAFIVFAVMIYVVVAFFILVKSIHRRIQKKERARERRSSLWPSTASTSREVSRYGGLRGFELGNSSPSGPSVTQPGAPPGNEMPVHPLWNPTLPRSHTSLVGNGTESLRRNEVSSHRNHEEGSMNPASNWI